MKTILISSLFSLCLIISTSYASGVSERDRELMLSSFYTGCISGIVAVIEAGYYTNKGQDPKKAYANMQNRSKSHVEWYNGFIKEQDSKK